MTPISLYEGKKVVRHTSREPTPYLASFDYTLNIRCRILKAHGHKPQAVDIGCGNGRNAKYLEQLGYEVFSFDRKPDYGVQIELGKPLPILKHSIHVVLLQYVLMLLDTNTCYKVIQQGFDMCANSAMLVVEVADVKNSLCHGDELVDLMDVIEEMAMEQGFATNRHEKFKMLAVKA